MKTPNSFLSILMIVLMILSCNSCDGQSSHSPPQNDFLKCMSLHLPNNTGISSVVYTPNDASYLSILLSSVRSLRFRSASTPRPQVIVTPFEESQIQTTILCARENGMQIRIRSGGHDYEGLSYTSQVPFVVLDLFNFSEVAIDVNQKTAWVGAGAIIGQLYYRISQTRKTLAFPAGACPTVGVGGLFSGGGYGPMLRKFGLAADNIIDARIIDVPETLTIFSVGRTLEQNATQLVHKWQYIAPNLDEDILLSISIGPVNSSGAAGGKTIQANFNSVYLGGVDKLLPLLEQSFPELGVRREDCTAVSWMQSALFFGGYSIQVSPEVVTSRNPEISSTLPITRYYFKAKLDYVQEPISIKGFEGMWKLLLEREANMGELLVVPYGGKMKEISETALPFPHSRKSLQNSTIGLLGREWSSCIGKIDKLVEETT
ncbi:hypothetical protein ACP275_13G054400 [Erythranthe tilingii]